MILEVGKPYPGLEFPLEGRIVYQYDVEGHTLLLMLRNVQLPEVVMVQRRCEFGLLVHADVIFLLYRFGLVPWGDAPYAWHLVAKERQALPEPGTENTRALLQVVLADANTGIVKALRAVTFSPKFTQALHQAIRDQAAGVSLDRAVYDQQIRDAYRVYGGSEAMASAAPVRCRGGSEAMASVAPVRCRGGE